MTTEATVRGAFRVQEHYCREMAAPIYAALSAAIADGMTRDHPVGARVLDWPGEPTRDALPLRLVGGLHALVLAQADAELSAIFAGTAPADAATLNRVLARNATALMPWLDGPPQTNESGRSGALIVGLMTAAQWFGLPLEVLEIGSSGGLNLLIDRYRFDLGGTAFGPADAPVTIAPEWQGPAPIPVPLDIVSIRGCDVQPLDVTDPAVAQRLAAFVWPEQRARQARLTAAIAMVRERPVQLDQADAADWIEARLAKPQAVGVTRVLMHSVVWQYLPEPVAERIRQAMAAAGAAATAARPLAWVAMEPDRALAEQVVSVRGWPGHAAWEVVATAHAHASWVRPGGRTDRAPTIELAAAARVVI